jgi:hypothetical protein
MTKKPLTYFTVRLENAIRDILADRTHGRELDSAFENYDGDQMATAIVRRCRTNPRLDQIIRSRYSTPRCDWYQIAALRDTLTDDQLEAEADETRRIERNTFYMTWAIQDGQPEKYQPLQRLDAHSF